MSWVAAFALTVAIEAVVYTSLLRPRGYGVVECLALALALNVATHPLVWFAFPDTWGGWFAAEGFAWLAEAALLGAAGAVRQRDRALGPVEAGAIALAANGVTASVGLLL